MEAEEPLPESLWEQESKNPDSVPSPDWHREALEEAQRQIDSGEAKFMSSDEAWADIKRRCIRFAELDEVVIRESLTAENFLGGSVKIEKGWGGTIVSDANTPQPFVEFTRYSETPILASIPVEKLSLERSLLVRSENDLDRNHDISEGKLQVLEQTRRRIESGELKGEALEEAIKDIERRCKK